jgi:hypothetical protein
LKTHHCSQVQWETDWHDVLVFGRGLIQITASHRIGLGLSTI